MVFCSSPASRWTGPAPGLEHLLHRPDVLGGGLQRDLLHALLVLQLKLLDGLQRARVLLDLVRVGRGFGLERGQLDLVALVLVLRIQLQQLLHRDDALLLAELGWGLLRIDFGQRAVCGLGAHRVRALGLLGGGALGLCDLILDCLRLFRLFAVHGDGGLQFLPLDVQQLIVMTLRGFFLAAVAFHERVVLLLRLPLGLCRGAAAAIAALLLLLRRPASRRWCHRHRPRAVP